MDAMLPEYLKMHTNAAPRAEQVHACGELRVTVITPRLLRLEVGQVCDEATQVVLDRSFGDSTCHICETEGVWTLETSALRLKYQVGQKLSAETLCIEHLGEPAFTWHYGDVTTGNLGGTAETLDGADGAIRLTDGVCSLDGWALLDDSETAILRQDGWFEARPKAVDLYFFGYGHDYTACVQDYYRLTGLPQMLPAYVLGNWWSRYYIYTQEEYLNLMDRFRDEDVPLSVGIVDMDWHLVEGDGRTRHDGWTGYTWNRELFPDDKAFFEGMQKRQLRTALNLHPAQGVRYWEEQYEDMAKAMGIDPATKAPVPCDYLSPAYLKEYFEQLHFPYERDGVDFWWLDWQQGSDYARLTGNNDPAMQPLAKAVHPLWMVNHMHYMASRRHGGRGLIFSRFAGYGSQRYPIGFSGDSLITWKSLEFQPYFTSTASNVGYGWWSHDIGGHTDGTRDDELTVRWVQFGVFSPIFRLHSTKNPFMGREMWNYGVQAEGIIKEQMRLRHRLFPYLYTMNRRNVTELLPLMRPMYHVYPEEKNAYRVRNQYWFGSEMIVAPITRKADAVSLQGAVDVWLPEGVWTDAFTGMVYRGGKMVTMHRPLERIPVLLKPGAVVPMQAHQPHDNTLGAGKTMEVLIAPGADNRVTLYEDDGLSLDFEQGRFAETPMSLAWQEKEAAFTIHAAQGETALIPEKRDYRLLLRGFRPGCTFAVDGAPLAAAWDAATCTYTVEVPEVVATNGITVTMQHEGGLQDNLSNVKERIFDLMNRAQSGLHNKARIWNRICRRIDNPDIPVGHREQIFLTEEEEPMMEAVMELYNTWMDLR